jgi:hypothetical protein
MNYSAGGQKVTSAQGEHGEKQSGTAGGETTAAGGDPLRKAESSSHRRCHYLTLSAALRKPRGFFTK